MPPDGPTPLVAGPLFGLRTWTVVADGDAERLAGPHRTDMPWPTRGAWLEATCSLVAAHDAPVHDCSCGVHAWHPSVRSARRALAFRRDVAGVVECSGTVEIHPEGFRAQRGRPFALVVTPGRNARQIARLAEAYAAEVVEVGGAEDLVDWCRDRRLGLDEPVVDELLGPGTAARWREESRKRRRSAVLRVGGALAVAIALAVGAYVALPDPDGPRDLFGRAGRVHVR
jgi:hypothetical protein